MPKNRIPFMNTFLDNISAAEALDYIDDWIASGKPGRIITPNCDHIVQIEKKPSLKPVWDSAELLLADGHPLLWFANFLVQLRVLPKKRLKDCRRITPDFVSPERIHLLSGLKKNRKKSKKSIQC